MDPRNGLSLHDRVAEALDRSDIAIIPVPSETRDGINAWKTIVINENIRKRYVICCAATWNDLDGKILKSRGDNRPARRYL